MTRVLHDGDYLTVQWGSDNVGPAADLAVGLFLIATALT